MKTIIFATTNNHKLEEVNQILKHCKAIALSQKYDVEENGTTYAENALIKAKEAYKRFKQPVFADDSGIEIKALNHWPGLKSARVLNTEYKLKEIYDLCKMNNYNELSFHCAIAYIDANGIDHIFTAVIEGKLASRFCEYEDTFGYDPIFVPNGSEITYAQMSKQQKNHCSHRAIALAQFEEWLKNNE
ncbi:RdgB/HAM1 family non-canonical purine NTP pyrophosphatase [Mycoplasma phocoenae]|uniref:RdgB/HAM1 family non-canonical purine NTP pyrophosphatase n=1 Tax=Mycoplasma phocoenae TaxID=754517 RepID=A0A858U711_9MOLU|nr:RdgB/HAM1 family non-canonical purine NTP pyrophosphatase [Mycoplasma phocoenae]QJG67237.1 RdgB/HAM1 family non-canonical purine NTP pyrophosphatase [Mycoplasma phocoenae]